MRLHTDSIDALEISKVLRLAGVTATKFSEHKSRSRDHAFNLTLSGSSFRQQNFGTEKAATWDEWGFVISALFALDPKMTIPNAYVSADHFHWATGNRYADFDLAGQHRNHKWEFSGESAGGGYMVHACTGCSAIRRFTTRQTWQEFTAANA